MAQTKLHNDCEGCSFCCEHLMMPLIPHPQVVAFHENWGNEIREDRHGKPWACMKVKCQHLGDDGLCDDYENRPIQCHNYPNDVQYIYWDDCALMRKKYKKE
jgi:Fe-S-cluster containining protein